MSGPDQNRTLAVLLLRTIAGALIIYGAVQIVISVIARAESVAEAVSRQAELFKIRRNEEKEKLEQFRVLGEKVRELTAAISSFRPADGKHLSGEDRAKLRSNVPGLEAQLVSLIEELQNLRKSARDSRMKALEKNAESLAQTLEAVRKKLGDLPQH